MSEQIINKSLQVKLLECLKNTELYPQFLECVAKEMANIEKKFFEISQIYNIESNNYNNLVNICDTFGYIPNMDIDGSFEMVRNEIKCIPQKIKSKTTYQGYNLILKQIKENGDSYNYFVSPDENGEKLCKSLNYQSIIEDLNKSSLDNVFNKVSPNKNYAINFEGNTPTLDFLLGRHIVNEIENSNMYLPYIDLEDKTTESEIRSLYEIYLANNGITDDSEKTRITNEIISKINDVGLENYNKELLGTYFKTVNKDLLLRKYSLDKIIASTSWLLDSSTPIFSSNHIGVEYYPQNSYCVYRKTFGNMNDYDISYICKIDNVNDIKIKNGNPIINIYLNGIQKYLTFNVESDKIEFFSQDSFYGKMALKDLDSNFVKGTVEITFLESYFERIKNDVNVNSLDDIEIIIEYGVNKFITSDLFRYMDNGVQYNRRVCVVPHTGININTLCKKGNTQINNLLETETWVSDEITLDGVKTINSIYVDDEGNEKIYGTYHINSQEKYENEYWMILQSYVKANDVTNEEHPFDTTSEEISIILNEKPVYPQFFEMQFQRGNEGYKIIKADKDGNLYGDKRDETIKNVLGKINYDEGIVNFYKSYNQSLSKNLANSVSNTEPILYCKTIGTKKTWFKDENYTDVVVGTIDDKNSTVGEKIFEYQVLGEESTINNHIFNSESNEYLFYLERTLETEVQQFLVNTATSTDYLYAKNRDTSTYYSQVKCEDKDKRYIFVIKDENSGNVIYSNKNNETGKIYIYRDLDCKNEIHVHKTPTGNAYSYVYSLGDNFNKYTDLTFSSIYDGTTDGECNAVLSYTEGSANEILLIQQSFKVSDSTFDLNEVANYCPYYDVLVSTFSNTLKFNIPDNFDDPITNNFILNCNLRDESGNEQNHNFTFGSDWSHDESGNTLIDDSELRSNIVTITFNQKYVWFGSVNCEYTSMVTLHLNEETIDEESTISKYPLKFNYKTSNSLNINKISFVGEVKYEEEGQETPIVETKELAYIKFPEVEFDNIKNHVSAFIGIKL